MFPRREGPKLTQAPPRRGSSCHDESSSFRGGPFGVLEERSNGVLGESGGGDNVDLHGEVDVLFGYVEEGDV